MRVGVDNSIAARAVKARAAILSSKAHLSLMAGAYLPVGSTVIFRLFDEQSRDVESHRITLDEGMNVDSDSSPDRHFGDLSDLALAIASATGMSSGVVTLMFSCDPMNSLTGRPSISTIPASSVASSLIVV